jgi:hypothetical protein
MSLGSDETGKYFPNCVHCKTAILDGASFCLNCGAANLKNSYIREKTTANYDPVSKDYKPWRESVHLHSRSKNLKNILPKNVEPWKYTKKNVNESARKKNTSYKKKDEESAEDKRIYPKQQGIKTFLGLRFKKVGYDLNRNSIVKLQPGDEGDVNAIIPVQRKLIEQNAYPLAAYLIDWLPIADGD